MQGREWTSLALLAPGNRTTAMGNGQPVQDRNDGEARDFQLNMDGQQITSNLGTGNQPYYSQDSIAEFQFISNRFDATQGRSAGVQVNAITKSGTNRFSGSFNASFRDDSLNAEDHVLEVGRAVLEPAVQRHDRRADHPRQGALLRQLSVRPRAANEHLEHALSTSSTSRSTARTRRKMGGGRVDYQISPQTRLMGKAHAAQAVRSRSGPATTTIRREPTRPRRSIARSSAQSRRC